VCAHQRPQLLYTAICHSGFLTAIEDAVKQPGHWPHYLMAPDSQQPIAGFFLPPCVEHTNLISSAYWVVPNHFQNLARRPTTATTGSAATDGLQDAFCRYKCTRNHVWKQLQQVNNLDDYLRSNLTTQKPFLLRNAMLARYMPQSCVCLSVTSRCSTETAKHRIMQTMPHESPGTL